MLQEFCARSPGWPRRFRPSLERLEDRVAPATLVVTTLADIVNLSDGKRSLREAINQANATAAPDTIVLSAGVHRITQAGSNEDANQTGDFDILNALTLKGQGAAATVIDGNGLDRLFHVLPATSFTVKFSGVTIRGGLTSDVGGGVYVDDSITNAVNLIVTRSIITGNAATNNFGGGINIRAGGLTLTDTTVSNNSTASDDGGGIFF
jgi:CSLREA domain-containing protein